MHLWLIITPLKAKQALVIIWRWPRGVPHAIEKDWFDLLYYFCSTLNKFTHGWWCMVWVIPIMTQLEVIHIYSTLDCGNFLDIFAELIKVIPSTKQILWDKCKRFINKGSLDFGSVYVQQVTGNQLKIHNEFRRVKTLLQWRKN